MIYKGEDIILSGVSIIRLCKNKIIDENTRGLRKRIKLLTNFLKGTEIVKAYIMIVQCT